MIRYLAFVVLSHVVFAESAKGKIYAKRELFKPRTFTFIADDVGVEAAAVAGDPEEGANDAEPEKSQTARPFRIRRRRLRKRRRMGNLGK